MGWFEDYTYSATIDDMQKRGLVLTPEGEDLYWDFVRLVTDHGGCRCFISAPCSYCTHPGHPYSLVEAPELWESELVAEIRAATERKPT